MLLAWKYPWIDVGQAVFTETETMSDTILEHWDL